MITALKPIETRYRGCRFRSRLEARWAVFFDALGVAWEYEREGFDLGAGVRYLPDFWLPEQECWIEIKAEAPGADEDAKCRRLALQSGHDAYVFFGPVPSGGGNGRLEQPGDGQSAYRHLGRGGWDLDHWWCECPSCGRVGIAFEGRSDRLPCKRCAFCERIRTGGRDAFSWARAGVSVGRCPIHGAALSEAGCPRSLHGDRGHSWQTPGLLAAYAAARSARFEHGERG